MVLLAITGMVFQALFTLLMHLSEDNKNIHAFVTALIMYSLCNAVVVPFYTIGMNYACEITYPVGESINGGIMMSMSQVSGIAGTFLCDYLINHKKKKKYLTNVVMLGFFVVASIFVFLFDEKLDRHEAEAESKLNNKEKEKEEKENNEQLDNLETIQVNNNNINDNEKDDNKEIAKNLLKA